MGVGVGGGMAFVRQHGFGLHTQACSLPAAASLRLPSSQPGRGGSAALKYFWRIKMSAARLHLFGDWMDDVI